MRLRSNVPLRNSCWVSCASTQTSERFDTHSSRLGLHCSLSLEPCNPVERIDSRVRDMRTEVVVVGRKAASATAGLALKYIHVTASLNIKLPNFHLS